MQSVLHGQFGSNDRPFGRLAATLASALALASLGGCALSRAEKLERKADTIESRLVNERDKAVSNRVADAAASSAKLNHLTTLRGTLSIANGALAAVPYVFKEPEQNLAYDVLDEVYGTIDWNIPLLPGDQTMKAMPASFSNGRINLTAPK